MNNHTSQNRKGEPIRPRNDPSRTRRTHDVPFVAACSHFVRKSTMFPAPASQYESHATFMQPLQCILQNHVAHPHLSTHMATKRDNNHAAITLRSAKTDSKKPYSTHQQPHVAEHQGRTDYASKRSQPHPPHTAATLYTAKNKVSCSGFLPNTSTMRHSCSHSMRFAASRV